MGALPAALATRSWRLMLLLLPLAASRCYSPAIEDCDYRCGEGDACPDGFGCHGGYCVRRAETECVVRAAAGGPGSGAEAVGGAGGGAGSRGQAWGGSAGATDVGAGAGGEAGALDAGGGGGAGPAASGRSGASGAGGDGSGTPVAAGGGGGGGADPGASGAEGNGVSASADPPAMDPLPDPCIGGPYEASLSAHGGTPPYAYELLSGEGLSVDADAGVILGTVGNAGPVTVRVTDSLGARGEATLHPRERCWLAYIAADATGATALHLYDPLLGSRLPTSGDATLGAGATDFAFSPDGRYLAYRRPESGAAMRLELVELMTASTRVFSFTGPSTEGSVTRYVWSPDSMALAVAFEADDGVWLSGLRRGASGPAPVTEGPIASELDDIVQFDAAAPFEAPTAPIVELAWVGTEGVVFTQGASSASEDARSVAHAPMEAAGFVPEPNLFTFTGALRLLATPDGVFCFQAGPSRTILRFALPSHDSPLTRWDELGSSLVVSPAGELASFQSADGALRLYRTDSPPGDGMAPAPFASVSGCDATLSWAAESARVACVHDGDDGAEFLVTDVAEDGTTSDRSSIAVDPEYGAEAASGRPRALSPSGRFLAYAGPSALCVADLVGTPLTQVFRSGVPGEEVALAYSPDERRLAAQWGGQLWIHDLTDLSSLPLSLNGLSDPIAAPVPCEEDFAKDPVGWCGNPRSAGRFAWSPDSSRLAYVTEAGALWLADVSAPGRSVTEDVARCDPACIQQFAFQP